MTPAPTKPNVTSYCCFQSIRSFIPRNFTDLTEKSAAKRGWLTTTGTSRRTTRWDVTLTNEDGTEDNHRRGIDDPDKETKAL